MNGKQNTIGGAIVALVTATIGLAVAFGVHLDTAERDAILSFVTAAIAVAPVVGALLDHGHAQASARVEAASIASSNPSTAPNGPGS